MLDAGTLPRCTVRESATPRQVRGIGTLKPEERFHVAAQSAGRVESVRVATGARVSSGTAIVQLRSLELEQQAADAAWNLQTAEADLINLKAQIRNQRASHLSDLAALRAQHRDAVLKNERDQLLFKQGLMLELDYRLSNAAVGDLAERIRLAEEEQSAQNESFDAQLASKQASLKQLRELLRVRRDQLDALRVCAGLSGIVDEILVQAGQQVAAGADLAVVVQPWKLAVSLTIPELQARDVETGQKVAIETQHGSAHGHIARIDPSSSNGTRVVDVRLDSPLPAGSAPNESVDGVVDLAEIENTLYIDAAAGMAGLDETTVFRVSPDGKRATRVRIALGRVSPAGVQVLHGLRPGDQVILSDIPAAKDRDEIRLK